MHGNFRKSDTFFMRLHSVKNFLLFIYSFSFKQQHQKRDIGFFDYLDTVLEVFIEYSFGASIYERMIVLQAGQVMVRKNIYTKFVAR